MRIRPFEVRALARLLARDASVAKRHLHQLRLASDAVSLHPADPGLDRTTHARRSAALAGLHRSAVELVDVARQLESAATDALVADDNGDAPICRLPGGMLSRLDRTLTDLVGDGLSAATMQAVVAAASIVPNNNQAASGDPDGRFTSRPVPLLTSRPGPGGGSQSHAERLITAALDATADQAMLAHDEFGLIDHGRDHYTVVLPGVVDLRHPEPGWNPVHRSPRDLDMAALRSSRSSATADNAYARSVAEALAAVGVSRGARLTIVGHSFGADTALDLAADPTFTRRHRVTHVVASGHFSQPQPGSVAAGTKVLIVQNRHDVVVNLGSSMPTAEAGVFACSPTRAADDDRVKVVRFDGGFNGFGHAVDVYRPVFTGDVELDAGDAEVVDAFLASIEQRSEPPETMMAVDISLPRRRSGNQR